ncbi:hypothetical protein [Brevibacillus centrosporus]|uniref:hypothetical protein n=1 Tax=Brevibacillus centrosporus TaxID=54910 RepID=UPI002E1CC4BE|nr:hypothetical protein [Brevibacillus centrosporus]
MLDKPDSHSMRFGWDDQTSDSDLHHFEVYFSNGSNVEMRNYPREKTADNLISDPGKILDLIDAQDGDTITITVYAVDSSGNKSDDVTASAVYSLTNTSAPN